MIIEVKVINEINSYSLFLDVLQLDNIPSCKHLKLLQSDGLLVPEVPLDQVFKLALFELEPRALDERLELLDLNLIGLFMFDAEEQSFEEHAILLFIGEFIGVGRLIRLHQVAKLIFIQVFLVH